MHFTWGWRNVFWRQHELFVTIRREEMNAHLKLVLWNKTARLRPETSGDENSSIRGSPKVGLSFILGSFTLQQYFIPGRWLVPWRGDSPPALKLGPVIQNEEWSFWRLKSSRPRRWEIATLSFTINSIAWAPGSEVCLTVSNERKLASAPHRVITGASFLSFRLCNRESAEDSLWCHGLVWKEKEILD